MEIQLTKEQATQLIDAVATAIYFDREYPSDLLCQEAYEERMEQLRELEDFLILNTSTTPTYRHMLPVELGTIQEIDGRQYKVIDNSSAILVTSELIKTNAA